MRVSWGPQHPASGQLRLVLEVEGDIVVNCHPDLGYTHRGIEKIAENRTYIQLVPIVERICNLDSFNMALGYAAAVEELAGIEVPERAKRIRVVMAELNRIMSHLYWLALFGVGAGLFTSLMWPIADRELFIDLAEMATGGRVTYSYILPGGVRSDLPQEFEKKAAQTLDYFERRLNELEDFVLRSRIYQIRTQGVGVLKPQDAIVLGAAGPSLRGSGVRSDVRRDEPYAVYDEFEFEVPVGEFGDCYSRAYVRFCEMRQSILIIRQALRKLPEGPVRAKFPTRLPEGEVYSRVEAARGELGYYIRSDGKPTPYRFKVSTPSFRNALVLQHVARGARLADIPVIYFSFDIFPLDADR